MFMVCCWFIYYFYGGSETEPFLCHFGYCLLCLYGMSPIVGFVCSYVNF
jgi:hypothetical protein